MTTKSFSSMRTPSTAALALLLTVTVFAQAPQVSRAQMKKEIEDRLHGPASKPFDGFRVIDNIYYVGIEGISSFLITTSAGAILIDTGTEQMMPVIRNNVEKLGFKPRDIQIILSTHAHFDHIEGHAAMKALTGAKVMAVDEDAKALASGIDTSSGEHVGWKPVKVDRVLKDGDTVTLGGATLQAHLTPGHTKGATAWTMTAHDGGKPIRVVIAGATAVNPGTTLLGNRIHPTVVSDFARTFRVLKGLNADVFLPSHPGQFGMEEKLKQLKAGKSPNPFVDPAGYKQFIEDGERVYLKQLEAERAAAKT